MIYFSQHFTLEEMCKTSHAKLEDNLPDPISEEHLIWVCVEVLEPARKQLGEPIVITSGYRNKFVNKAVGGVPNSAHTKGLAVDIHVKNEDYAKRLFQILKANKYADRILFEHNGNAKWLHAQFSKTPARIFNYNYVVKK